MVAEMELAGLGKSDRDLLLAYLGQIPYGHRADVLKDRRSYPLIDAGWSLPHQSVTWRVAHRVLVKLEEAETGSKSLVVLVVPAAGDGHGGRNRRKNGKGTADDDPGVAAVGDAPCRVCFNMRDSKTCDRDNCQYSHDPTALAEARRLAKGKGKGKGGKGK